MNRGKKAAYNSIASLFAETVAIICGLVIPRLILKSFGSSYNGFIQSVAQFLSVVTLLRAGVGGATRAALYKALAKKDTYKTSAIIKATELFMRKVALIFVAFTLLFSCIYPLLVKNDFDWLFSASLVLIISLSTFVEYYFGITYSILIQADQRQYIISILGAVTTIINTILSLLLINNGFGIHIVKLGSALAYCFTPIFLYFYAHRYYCIDKNVAPDFSSIDQRWDALFHQLAGFIYSNTDIMLITIFSDLKEVSVYTTYCLVSNGLKKLMLTVTNGVEAAFGDMIAKDDQNILISNVRVYETLLHGIVCVLYGSALVLITPFIRIYTKGVIDAEYSRVAFGCFLIITETVHLLRQPYHSLAEASGHYKQTKHIAIIQVILNLGVSIILINSLGIVGVIIGTLVSDWYGGIAYRVYVQKHIIHEIKTRDYVKRYCVTALNILCIYLLSLLYPRNQLNSFKEWIMFAVTITVIATLVTVACELCFYKDESFNLRFKIKAIVRNILHR